MCGILGILSRHNQNHGFDTLWVNKLNLLNHRGPDGTGTYIDDHLFLGHTRLSIIDLTQNASQPMLDNSRNYIIAFNGEIYNYVELRRLLEEKGYKFKSNSDTEVLLTSYLEWGEQCAQKIEGMFVFTIWDKRNKTLSLFRDAFGEKPIYYYKDENYFIFASELKVLKSVIFDKLSLNLKSINQFLSYQYVPEPNTLFNEVLKLRQSHFLKIDIVKFETNINQYWKMDLENYEIDSKILKIEDTFPLISQRISESIKISLRSDVKVGISLSGGLDSSTIASFAINQGFSNLSAFSVGYPGRPRYDERKLAEELARKLNMNFFEVEIETQEFLSGFKKMVYQLDDPIADPAAFANEYVSKLASENSTKVVLSGIGADELFWGYSWVKNVAMSQQVEKTKRNNIRYLANAISKLSIYDFYNIAKNIHDYKAFNLIENSGTKKYTPNDQIYFYENEPQFAKSFSLKNKYCGETINSRIISEIFEPTHGAYGNVKEVSITEMICNTWLSSNCLPQNDRLGMLHGVETRAPFLNKTLVNEIMAIRKKFKDQEYENKYLLKNSVRGVVDESIITREKQGFRPPVQEWLFAVVDNHLDELLTGPLVKNKIIKENLEKYVISSDIKEWHCLFFWYKLTMLHCWLETMHEK